MPGDSEGAKWSELRAPLPVFPAAMVQHTWNTDSPPPVFIATGLFIDSKHVSLFHSLLLSTQVL